MKKLIFLTLLFALVGSASAWGPNTHLTITDKGLEACSKDLECNSSIIYKTIMANQDAYRCGFMFPDVSVIYYYLKFDNYEATHSWSFCDKVLEYAKTDDEKAAAYGCFSHLVADTVSHNYFIPKIIQDTNIPNDIIHPAVEGVVEANYIDNIRTPHSLDPVDKYLPLFNRAANKDMTSEAYLLKSAIGGQNFYNTQYTVPEDSTILSVWKFIATTVIQTGLIKADVGADYIQETNDRTMEYYKTGVYPPLDPTGAAKLDIYGSRSRMSTYFMFIIVPLLLFVLYLVLKKLGIISKAKEMVGK